MADVLMAVTRHQRMSLPSASIIDPVIVTFQVAGGSPGWQVAGLAAAQRETGDRMIGWGRNTFRSQVSAIRSLVRVPRFRCRFGFGFGKSALCHLSSIQPSIQTSTQSSIQSSLCFFLSANR